MEFNDKEHFLNSWFQEVKNVVLTFLKDLKHSKRNEAVVNLMVVARFGIKKCHKTTELCHYVLTKLLQKY